MRAAALALLVGLSLSPAAHAEDGRGCVSGPEWSHMEDTLGDVNHSARRSVLEQTWGVSPVGARNRYWQPANPLRWYSYAYPFCGIDRVLIVVVYRETSDAWQYAVKGEFV